MCHKTVHKCYRLKFSIVPWGYDVTINIVFARSEPIDIVTQGTITVSKSNIVTNYRNKHRNSWKIFIISAFFRNFVLCPIGTTAANHPNFITHTVRFGAFPPSVQITFRKHFFHPCRVAFLIVVRTAVLKHRITTGSQKHGPVSSLGMRSKSSVYVQRPAQLSCPVQCGWGITGW